MSHAATRGAAIAGALLAMFAGGSVLAEDKTDKESPKLVKCLGGNTCKGQSACKTAKTACKGQNACKGLGVTMVTSAKECAAAGGEVAGD